MMLSFDDMDLNKINITVFNKASLYCIDDSPLQNQVLFPGCYGICAVSKLRRILGELGEACDWQIFFVGLSSEQLRLGLFRAEFLFMLQRERDRPASHWEVRMASRSHHDRHRLPS